MSSRSLIDAEESELDVLIQRCKRDSVLRYLVSCSGTPHVVDHVNSNRVQGLLEKLRGKQADPLMPPALRSILNNPNSESLLQSLVFSRMQQIEKLNSLETTLKTTPCSSNKKINSPVSPCNSVLPITVHRAPDFAQYNPEKSQQLKRLPSLSAFDPLKPPKVTPLICPTSPSSQRVDLMWFSPTSKSSGAKKVHDTLPYNTRQVLKDRTSQHQHTYQA
mmetsp:Transcript_14901/g.26031  ORF Transcript_14901/g.26031 Transcript_14901/m.26031 type:complete len:219 (+) Transcript_14901:584-1240(+)|eukprot:CAMPEP_0203762056 /NCGR_PEP_ID=MMETSP0098-20131031/15019_1 /ASSEMBLY_ACC=CAM_ASM_000208 /TAXON_ID=96639 /ORGANISM=" , Strain NY0313808BC1" /LENGTH=218 /DNA_ID=CAMNT_0050656305 /DNA_START=126 /DNA_END=782 /DNA_ORIENTATION=-